MKKIIILIFILLNYISLVYSASTKKWEFNSYENFINGKFYGVSLTEDGELLLSPEIEKFESINCIYVWDIQKDSKGNIYIATGNEGLIYKIDKNNNITKFFETASISAFKILIDDEDNLYVITLTKGLLYKINPDGRGEVIFVFKGDHIWDMIFEDKENIILATGVPGILYRFNIKTKEIKEICNTTEMHILKVLKYKENLYFVTSDNGALYKYSLKDNKQEVIFESPNNNEIHTIAIRESDGAIFIGTADKDLADTSKFLSLPSEDIKKREEKQQTQDIYQKTQVLYNYVYKITQDGKKKEILSMPNHAFLSFEFDKDDNLYIGTGDKGIIYKCDKKDKIQKIVDNEENQVLSLKFIKNKIFYGTGNSGKLYAIKNEYINEGVYISEILDAKGLAKWGKIIFDWNKQDNTELKIYTRSGNTSKFDQSWSDWCEISTNFNILSPQAQFLQFKIVLKTKNKFITPIVSSLKIFYLLNNNSPQINKIETEFSDKASSEKVKESDLSKTFSKTYTLKIKWNATDPDGDNLIYTLMAKIEEPHNEWILLGKELTTSEYVIDIRKLPDGIYKFKVIADDIPSNGKGYNLKDEMVSKKVVIDKTPPEIVELKYEIKDNNSFKIYGKIIDALSCINSISYSVDAQSWINLLPKDMIFDSQIEEFEFEYKNNTKPNIIMIMASDEFGNINTKYLKIK